MQALWSHRQHANEQFWGDRGNDQDIKVFWRRTREKFFAAMGRGEYRTADSFSGKWTAMRTKITDFNNLHNHYANIIRRRSGSSDVDVMTSAHNDYRLHHGHPFTMIPLWELLCKSPKWHFVPSFNPTAHRPRRSKSTSTTEPSESDARTTINLNDDFDEFEQPQELPRPKGRDRSKVAARDTSFSTPSDGPSKLNKFDNRLNKLLSTKEKEQELKMEKQIQKDMEFLAKDFSHLAEEDRVILEARKA
ncbi:uncharacterized protein LOC110942679 [Helianthus annuus]|uniref:uncharacterized protein LOC110942679 n=1 Tax=Helianthus annuus TaxID=4232 RepID=UPI001653015A|nr:uncharacterized protein LOC110942679 [Helianthus annuus]